MVRVVSAIAALLALAHPLAAHAVELEGYWYVLVHFQDSTTNKPMAWRWEDRVWHFARRGDAIEWTEWPIVALEDETGRFEHLSGSRAARVVAAWEPNARQLADIKDGLAANTRGQQKKELGPRGAAGSWSSADVPAAGAPATSIQGWAIEGMPVRPVFSQVNSTGVASTESMEGRTVFKTLAVSADGEELSGSFERDGTRTGRFRLIRTQETSFAGTQSLEERQRQGMAQQAAESGAVSPDEAAAMMGAQVQLPSSAAGPDRQRSRGVIRTAVEDAVKANGIDPARLAPQIDRITAQIESALFDQRKSLDEVQRMILRGAFAP